MRRLLPLYPATKIGEYPLNWKGIMRLVTAAAGTFIGVLATTLHAQDLDALVRSMGYELSL